MRMSRIGILVLAGVTCLWGSGFAPVPGDPACPPTCPNVCDLVPYDPTGNPAGNCALVSLTWTRKQDGCATEPNCQQCRQCLGRLRIEVTADPDCFYGQSNDIKVTWTIDGGSSQNAALGLQADGSGSFLDIRDLVASCGNWATYELTVDGSGGTEAWEIRYFCDPCSPQ